MQMKLPSFATGLDAVLERKAELELPESINTLSLLQMVYRGEVELTPQQMRAAIEALPFESPKLSATAVLHQGDFASRLERAIERSGKPLLMIEAKR